MRFIHTADWQIGMKAVHVGTAGDAVRSARLQAIANILKVSKEQQAQFILVAGDVFENNNVDRTLVHAVIDILRSAPCPVYIIPGNHDPYGPGSVWQHPGWKSSKLINLLLQPIATPIAGGTLYPCPLQETHGRQDPTKWIAQENKEQGIHIGLAHGSLEGICDNATDFPIAHAAAKNTGLHYLALGHWHSTTIISPNLAYSGTHETSKFGERDSGNVLLVDIDQQSKAASISPHRTGTLTWKQILHETSLEGTFAPLLQTLQQECNKENTLLNIKLQGVLHTQDREQLLLLQQFLETETLYHQLNIQDLRPPPEDSGWITELPLGVLRETAQRLQAADALADIPGIPAELLAELSTLALFELYALHSRLSIKEVGT